MSAVAKKARKSNVWARAPHDWYVEGPENTTALAEAETFHGSILDPACGQGNVIKGLAAAGITRAIGTDLVPRVSAPWFAGVHDFLGDAAPPYSRRPRNIICNPPYGGAKTAAAFARRAFEVATEKVALFVNARFLFSVARAEGLFRDHPVTKEYRIVPRPSVPPGEYLLEGNKAEGGTADYVWLIWDLTGQRQPEPPGWLIRKAGAP